MPLQRVVLLCALLLALRLAVPGAAWAAEPAQTSPIPAPPGLVTPDTGKPAVLPGSPPQAQPSVTSVTNVTNNNLTLPPLPTEQQADGLFQRVLILVLTALANALQALIGQAIGSGGPAGGGFITSTPPGSTYASAAVIDLWGKVRLAADAGLALIVAYSGALIALGKAQRSPYDEALALLPRIGLGLALANGSLWLGRQAIDLNNALCAGVGAALPGFGRAAGTSPTLADVLARLAYLLTDLLLILQMLMRLALVDVGLVLAPAGIVLYLLPGPGGGIVALGDVRWGSGSATFCELYVEQQTGMGNQGAIAAAAAARLASLGLLQPGLPTQPGVVVYFGPSPDNEGFGHVGIYLGGGRFRSITAYGLADAPLAGWRAPYLGFVDPTHIRSNRFGGVVSPRLGA